MLSEIFLIWRLIAPEGSVWFAHSERRIASNGILIDLIGAIFKGSALFPFNALVKILQCLQTPLRRVIFSSPFALAQAVGKPHSYCVRGRVHRGHGVRAARGHLESASSKLCLAY